MVDTDQDIARKNNDDKVGMTIVIAMTIVMLTCIIACAGVAITFILSAV
jgi:hypothetical protein